MFPDKINQFPLCPWLFPVSTAQNTNSLFSESNFHSPLLKDKQVEKLTRQREIPLAMASGRVEFSSPDVKCQIKLKYCRINKKREK